MYYLTSTLDQRYPPVKRRRKVIPALPTQIVLLKSGLNGSARHQYDQIFAESRALMAVAIRSTEGAPVTLPSEVR